MSAPASNHRYVRVLDALCCEPSVQERAASAAEREGDVLHAPRWPTHSRRHREAVVQLDKLRDERHVIDVRNLGLVGGVELAPRAGAPGARAYDVFVRCYETGVLTRYTGDILAFSPPLTIEEAQIDDIFAAVAEVLREAD
ncbi:aminotransferase class III-fold pyridoxal phosphate-dependent enzyme [Paraburkholderia sediminicola]